MFVTEPFLANAIMSLSQDYFLLALFSQLFYILLILNITSAQEKNENEVNDCDSLNSSLVVQQSPLEKGGVLLFHQAGLLFGLCL